MVSGGADSVALARLVPELFSEQSYTILHVNHGLRGEDADQDEAFVRGLADELGIPCVVRRFQLAAPEVVAGKNVEALGRQLRYQAAAELLQELNAPAAAPGAPGAPAPAPAPGAPATPAAPAPRIITAHTADDRTETFLMRVIKGGGRGALAGILAKSPCPATAGDPQPLVIRPLLACESQQLRSYLRQIGQPWRDDATNADTRYLRAGVRHQLVPLMLARNPRLHQTLGRSLDLLADEDAYLESLVDAAAAELLQQGHDDEGWPCATLAAQAGGLDPVLLRRLVRRACIYVMPADERLEAQHINTVIQGLQRVGFATDIPGAVEVRRGRDTLVIRRKKPHELPASQRFRHGK